MANDNDIGLDDMFGGPSTPDTNNEESTGLEVAERAPPPPAQPIQAAPTPQASLSDPIENNAPLPASQGGPIRALPPQPKKSALGRFLGLFIVAGLAGGLAFLVLGKKDVEPQAPVDEVVEESLPEAELDLDALRKKRPQNAPGCWQSNEGYRFAFVGGDGKRKLVDKVEEIPMLYRAGASCRKE